MVSVSRVFFLRAITACLHCQIHSLAEEGVLLNMFGLVMPLRAATCARRVSAPAEARLTLGPPAAPPCMIKFFAAELWVFPLCSAVLHPCCKKLMAQEDG